SVMTLKTRIMFFCLIWVLSAICAILGSAFIATATILPHTPYDIRFTPIVNNIRQDMGPWTRFNYFEPESGEFFENVTFEVREGEIFAQSSDKREIFEFRPWLLEENHVNGSVFFIEDPGILVFDFFNGTFYEVKVHHEQIWLNIPNKRLKLHYQLGENYKIMRFSYDFSGTGTGTATDLDEKVVGDYFEIVNRDFFDWLQLVARTIWNDFDDQFIAVSRNLLVIVTIGGGAGILTALILIVIPRLPILNRLLRLFNRKYLTYYILKALNGKLGTILSIIPIFDFNGEFYVEEKFVDDVNLSGVRSTLTELYKQRWYDILVFPTALVAIVTIFFVQNYPGEDEMAALMAAPILTPLALILVIIYFPLIWAYNEGGIKRFVISPQGDIVAVRPLGKILRDGVGLVVGLSGFLSLGFLALEVTDSFRPESSTAGQIQVAGFTLDIFSLLLLIFWTLGLFFLLLGSIIVGSSVLAVSYLQTNHFDNIEYLRAKSEKDGVIHNWGSVSYQFSPVAKKAIFTKITPSKIHEEKN
ncbi:MAG: hypothetical protein ACXACR_04160, partial [Candidatus Hodarchaeales archaeon]